jgi:hypothetical protein
LFYSLKVNKSLSIPVVISPTFLLSIHPSLS